ncbi:MAG: OmpA family protein [Candidatus Gastranaerophilales bacterium]|nr:OmpA family protein [Candidatus Gastranaerophilales bacterium]
MKNELYSYGQEYINRWVISYADFITMLLALFIVLYALSLIDISNLQKFSNSVEEYFPSNKQKIYDNNKVPIDLNEQKRQLSLVFNTTKADIKLNDVDISEQKIQINQLKNEVEDINIKLNKEAVEFKNIENLIENKLSDVKGLSVTRESRGLIIRLKDAVLFDAGSDIIKDKARVTLNRLAGVLKDIPNSIRIEGHTDNKPIKTPRFPSNWELSTARSTNIVRYLINNHRFSPNKLSAVGYGEYMPLTNNFNNEGQAVNRRVDIVILSSTSKIFEPSSNQ